MEDKVQVWLPKSMCDSVNAAFESCDRDEFAFLHELLSFALMGGERVVSAMIAGWDSETQKELVTIAAAGALLLSSIIPAQGEED